MIGKLENAANGFDGGEQFLEIGKRFENERNPRRALPAPALVRGKCREFLRRTLRACGANTPERTDRAGDHHFVARAFASFARDFYSAVIHALHFIAKPGRGKLQTIRAESVRLDELRAGFDVCADAREKQLRAAWSSIPRSSAADPRLRAAASPSLHRR